MEDNSILRNIVPDCARDTGAYPCGCEFVDLMQMVQNIINASVYLATFALVLLFAYVGFLYVTSPTNPSSRAQAKSMAISGIVGFVVVLGAFLIVSTVMNTFSDKDQYGNWNSFFGITRGHPEQCTSTDININTGGGGGVVVTPPGTGGTVPPDQAFTYQPGIRQQEAHASGRLLAFLGCMLPKIPGNVGEISSISDSLIVNGTKTFAQCAAGECQHVRNSLHYGGTTHVGQSYAVDFGDEQNASILMSAARECGATYVANEGNHVHAQVRP
jgi:hypothetical protein